MSSKDHPMYEKKKPRPAVTPAGAEFPLHQWAEEKRKVRALIIRLLRQCAAERARQAGALAAHAAGMSNALIQRQPK
jgi:hypothetical protein